ncbi:hypothetical protein niasHT_027588 [Heterodera trifolii]|uniref:Uncharacterized protein n=1 Tax=Heterodera trifolii TaxID=157864 RepID=A0ABD2K578_9BILA
MLWSFGWGCGNNSFPKICLRPAKGIPMAGGMFGEGRKKPHLKRKMLQRKGAGERLFAQQSRDELLGTSPNSFTFTMRKRGGGQFITLNVGICEMGRTNEQTNGRRKQTIHRKKVRGKSHGQWERDNAKIEP